MYARPMRRDEPVVCVAHQVRGRCMRPSSATLDTRRVWQTRSETNSRNDRICVRNCSSRGRRRPL